MTEPEAAAILDSLTWHSIVLGLDLTASQWQEHKRRLACRACEHATPLAQQVPEAFVKPVTTDA